MENRDTEETREEKEECRPSGQEWELRVDEGERPSVQDGEAGHDGPPGQGNGAGGVHPNEFSSDNPADRPPLRAHVSGERLCRLTSWLNIRFRCLAGRLGTRLRRLFPWLRVRPVISSFILMAILFLIALIRFGGGSGGRPETGRCFYVKDNSLYGAVLSDADARPQEFTSRYLEQWGSRPGGGILGDAGDREISLNGGKKPAEPLAQPSCSPSGRYLFYPERIGKSSFDLVRLDERKGESKTLDSGVVEFLPASDGGVVYLRENGGLYWYGGNRKRKITGQAAFYRVSESGGALLWTETGNDLTDLFYMDLAGTGEKVRLERNINLLDASPEFDKILVMKEDCVYLIQNQEPAELLAENVREAAAADAQAGTFYLVRDAGEESSGAYRELSYYSAGEEQLLSSDFGTFYFQEKGTVIYTKSGSSDVFCLAFYGNSGELDCAPAHPGQIAVNGEWLYFLSPDGAGEGGQPVYELCAANLNQEEAGRVRSVDRGVSELACGSGEGLCYYKETGEGTGDLFFEGKLAAYDVSVGTAAAVPGGGVLCIADYGSERQSGTLVLLEGGEKREIAGDVFGYAAISPDEIMILSGYRPGKKRGDLLRYDGAGTSLIETDVWGVFGDAYMEAVGRLCR